MNIKNKPEMKMIVAKMLTCFILIQPFLDYRPFFVDPKWQFMGITIPTIVRFLGIFVMVLLLFIDEPWKKEYIIYIIYFSTLAIYFIVHHIFATSELSLPTNYTYSLFGELFYLFRMILPFVIVYIVKNIKLSYKSFIQIIQVFSLIVGLVILIGNLFHISLTSYFTPDMHTKLNVIEWFTVGIDKYQFEELTSKGWFFMANQISGLMILLLPLNLYDFLKNHSALSVISTFVFSIAMLLLGTRVSTYGVIGMLSVFLILFLFFKIVRKEKELKWKNLIGYCVLFSISLILFINAPINNRIYSYGNVEMEEPVEEWENHVTTPESSDEKYILNHYKDYKLSETYLFSIYPYQQDTDFWMEYMRNNTGAVLNNRQMQELLVKRISEKNNSIAAKLLGFSYTRFTSGGLYLERDFFVQYYTVGIIGVILLLGPWIFWILNGLRKMITNSFKEFTFLNCALYGSVVACLGASLFSGHVVDELIVTLILGFIVGFANKAVESEGY